MIMIMIIMIITIIIIMTMMMMMMIMRMRMIMMMMILALIMIMIMMVLMITRVLQDVVRLPGQVRPRPAKREHREPPGWPVVHDGLHADWFHARHHAAQDVP